MQVKIVTPGRYLNDHLKAVRCQAAEILETKHWYAQELIQAGKAVAVQEAAVPKAKKAPVKKGKKTKEPDRTQIVENPFLER